MSYPSSDKTTNYSRLCRVVVDLCGDLLWDVLNKEIPTNLDTEVRKHLHHKTLRLDPHEAAKVTPTCARADCDTSILYKLIRFITTIKPTNGWYSARSLIVPGPADVAVGDDVERIHQLRNTLYGHVASAHVSEVDFRRIWQEVKDVCTRLDVWLGSGYESALCKLETECMDPTMEAEYREKLGKMHESWLKQHAEIEKLGGEIFQCNTYEMICGTE
jgi:hypothetical protein